MAGVGGLSRLEDIRISTQISLIAQFLPHFEILNFREGPWTEVGNFTNHQDMFGDLDWGSTMITVRILPIHFSFSFEGGWPGLVEYGTLSTLSIQPGFPYFPKSAVSDSARDVLLVYIASNGAHVRVHVRSAPGS